MKNGLGVYGHLKDCTFRDPTEEEKTGLKFPRDRFDLLSVDRVYEWTQNRSYRKAHEVKHTQTRKKSVWITVRCKKCGTVKQVADNPRMSCKQGPCHQRFIDWTGKKVNRLTPLRYIKSSWMRNKKPQWYWECRCDCGRLTLTKESRLALGLKVECDHCARMHNKEKTKLPGDLAIWHRIYRQMNRNAVSRNYVFELSFDEVHKMISSGQCYYCGCEPPMTSYGVKAFGLDRVDNTRGYTRDNVVPCCGTCNVMKMDATEQEFLNRVLMIAKHRKLTFNDYPEREYTQAGGNGEHLEKGEEIV